MYNNYGGAAVVQGTGTLQGEGQGGVGASVFLPGKRRRINLVAICINVFVPWFIFAILMSTMSFSFHYTQPAKAWGMVFGACILVFILFLVAMRNRKRDRDPMWYTFSTITTFAAVAVSTVLGDMNFYYNMQPYYDIRNLNTYPSVNPAISAGQEMMDAGRVYFSDGSTLDMSKSMSFQESDLYCVAPIVQGAGNLATYDFWAVGINCCSGISSDFRCGQFNNPQARSGLRLMHQEQAPYFRLAVQQAEAAYRIRSPHPLFFHWMQDPTAEMEVFLQTGWKWYLLSLFTYFAVNLFSVIVGVVGFSKTGHYP